MSKFLILLMAVTAFVSCNDDTQKADAYGNFEAEETMVSAEANGKILWLDIEEGLVVEKNLTIGLIDTIMPALQLKEVVAQGERIRANIKSIESQSNIIKQQKENLLIDLNRIKNLKSSGAATQKQFDDVTGGLQVIEKQIEANEVQKLAIITELKVLNTKKMLINEQLNKCRIKNPIKGTILEKYAQFGEITAAGKPLYKIADVENIILRAYVSGGQLHKIIKGGKCKVLIDKGKKEYMEFSGTITWISDKAEFTPKIIQTKKERVSMVYAIKIKVKNNGSIKIGMPGEVFFN